MSTVEICLRCARGRRAGEWSCPACGCEGYGSRLEGEGGPLVESAREPLHGLLGELLTLPGGGLAVLKGPKGIGKTTIALQAFAEPWIVTNEMQPELVRSYAKRLGVKIAGISQTQWIERLDEPEVFDLDLDLPEPAPPELVLDSLTGVGDPMVGLRALRDVLKAEGGRALAIVQVTAEGEARGGPRLEHECDVMIRLEVVDGFRQLVVEKNRFGELATRTFELRGEGAVTPARAAYYSIEGTAPRYRLVQHPNPSARYAGLYQAVERARRKGDASLIHLPNPPLATAAMESELYPLGFAEPDDIADRRRFAEANGLSYFFPARRSA